MSSKLKINVDTELSEIIFTYPKTLLFLQHLEIFVPIKEKNILQICEEKNIRGELFLLLLNVYIGNEFIVVRDLEINDIPTIICYLGNSHKYYQEDIYPNIQQSIQRLYELNTSAEIKMVGKFFQDYFNEVLLHLRYENEVSFPYIKSLYEFVTQGNKNINKGVYSVMDYKEQHNDIEEKLNDLMQLLIKYLFLDKDQQPRRELFMHLAELNYDLKIHTQIENMILIPLVEKIEKQIKR